MKLVTLPPHPSSVNLGHGLDFGNRVRYCHNSSVRRQIADNLNAKGYQL